MKLMFFQQLGLALLLLVGLMKCDSAGPEGPPEVIDTVFVSPPGDSPAAVAVNSRSDYVYVVNRNALVSVLKGKQLITTLPIGRQASPAIAVDEKHDRVYIISKYDDMVTIIQGTEVVTTVEVAGHFPLDITVEPQSGRTYVVDGYRKVTSDDDIPVVEGHLTIIDNDRVSGILIFEETLTRDIVVDPLEGYVYLGSVGGEVIVVKDMQEVARYDLKGGVAAMAPDPRTGEVYVMAPGPDNYDLYRFRRGKLVDKIDAEDATVGGTVQSLQVHPTTGDVYLVDYALKEVIIVRDMMVIKRLPVDWQPQAITIDPLTGNVYVSGFRFDTVTVIQGTEVLTTIPVGWKPYALDVNPATGRVYVANIAEDSVTILGFEE